MSQNRMEYCNRLLTTSKSRLPNIENPKFLFPYWDTMNVSNVQVTRTGRFMNVSTNEFSDLQGLWSNGLFNTRDERGAPVETYSNLQGSWARVGPSTYDSEHARGDTYNRWSADGYLPPTVKSLYDHRNVDPKGLWNQKEHTKMTCWP